MFFFVIALILDCCVKSTRCMGFSHSHFLRPELFSCELLTHQMIGEVLRIRWLAFSDEL